MPEDDAIVAKATKEGNKEKAPAFQFYPKDFLTDGKVLAMPLHVRGAYITLLCIDWVDDGINSSDLTSLSGLSPDDSKSLAQLCRCFVEHPSKPGFLTNARLQKEREKQAERREERIRAGQKGGLSNASKRLGDVAKLPFCYSKPLAKCSSSSSSSSSSSYSYIDREQPHSERVKNGSNGGNPDLLNNEINQGSTHEVNHDKEGGSGETNICEIGIMQKGNHCRISEIDLKMFEASKGPKFLERCFELANAWVEEARGDADFYKRKRRAQNCSALFQNWVFNAVEREFDDRNMRKARASPKQKLTTVDLNPEIFEEIFNERTKKIE